jgi:transposase
MVVLSRPSRGAPRQQRAATERSLRLAVTKRKVCGGSRSMDRFAQTADSHRVIPTCRTQGRSVTQFFKQVLRSQVFAEVSKPSLIPQT